MKLIHTIAFCVIVAALSALVAAQPSVRVITLPDFWGQYAIWGSSGVDANGRIWLGITSNDHGSGSAHLFRYDPATGEVTDTGDVVGALKRIGIYKPGEKQMKIHSRIVQMPDGYAYFASMDESGEKSDGSKLPSTPVARSQKSSVASERPPPWSTPSGWRGKRRS